MIETAPSAVTAEQCFEPRACPICGANDAHPVQVLKDYQFGTNGMAPRVTLQDVQCDRCGGLYRSPGFSEVGFKTLFAQAAASYGSIDPTARAAEQVKWLQREVPLGDYSSILDYGCGRGEFLKHLAVGLTHRPLGLEVDAAQRIVAHCRSRCDISAEWPDAYVDLVTLWHVLEHVPDPLGLLQDIRQRGVQHLVVEVPLLELHRHDDICGFMTPQHVTHFTTRTFIRVVVRAGWNIRKMEGQPHNGFRVYAVPVESVNIDRDDVCDSSIRHYIRHRIETCQRVDERLRHRTLGRDVIVWGAGMHTEALWHATTLRELPVRFLVDSDPIKQFHHWRGRPIEHPNRLQKVTDWRTTVLVVSSYGSQAEIVKQALALGVPQDAIVTLYDNPVGY